MIDPWNALSPQPSLHSGLLSITEILSDYNGPQIVVADWNGRTSLGVAADEDATAVRWILAPMSSVERHALAVGAMPTRELFTKDEAVTVLDVDENSQVVRVWDGVDGASLGDNLPDIGARLPALSRELLLRDIATVGEVEVALGHSSETEAPLGFRALAELLSVLQRFANAVAQATFPEPSGQGRFAGDVVRRATLGFASGAPGSLRIAVSPKDDEVLDVVLDHLSRALAAADNVDALLLSLSQLGPRVRARYEELLEVTRKNRLQVLGRSRQRSFYLSAPIAERISRAIATRVVEATHTRPAFGSFVAYDSGAHTFEFISDDDDAIYRGKVAKAVADTHRVIAVGPGAAYIVVISTHRRSGPQSSSETHELAEVVRQVDPNGAG